MRRDSRFPDGIDEMLREMDLREIMRLIERTARWVDPETFRLLPLWYPEYARRAYFYKADWSAPQMNRNRLSGHTEHKREGNRYANLALTRALGLRSIERRNWSCCHIWSLDDGLYQSHNSVVQDRRYFSCVANMVLLPAPMKAFTDTVPGVKDMLRICAKNLYGWHCDDANIADSIAKTDSWDQWDLYPHSWPRPGHTSLPRGLVKLDATIQRHAERRVMQIRSDLANAGPHYPREEVLQAIDYWRSLGHWKADVSTQSV